MPADVQLVTYADRLAGTIRGLVDLLRGPLNGLFGGVHLLPFFTPIDGADAGFDPSDHTEVDPRLGTWDDIAELARAVELTADIIVNHISAASPQFQDYLRNGAISAHAGMFLTLDRVFPDGATEADIVAIYRPRPGLPFTDVTFDDRSRRIMWTTFTRQQIDLDVEHPATTRYLQSILDRFAANGVRTARLDAVGYAVKTPGTSSFLTPQTFRFITQLRDWAAQRGLEVLAEIRSHYEQQQVVAQHVDQVYDFAFSTLVLHALFTGDTAPLRRWFAVRPRNAVTVLDTHDGIGIRDVGRDGNEPGRSGLLTDTELHRLVEQIHTNTSGQSRTASRTAASNADLYQVDSTYYDALARDDDAYLLARALQLFTPGIPQIYYVGLLAGTNDMELLAATGEGREINRHRYRPDELDRALQRPVVQQLIALIRFRNRHPAFGGSWSFDREGGWDLTMHWQSGPHFASLTVDLARRTLALDYTQDGAHRTAHDLTDLPA
jgi:sucrose phosphorylase